MQVLVQHAGRQWGPYNLEELRRALAEGRFERTDLAWHEGLPSWVPLKSLLDGAFEGNSENFRQSKPTSGLAVASLALGASSTIFCVLAGIPAVICGHLARAEIRRTPGRINGDGIAVAGLVLGYLSIALLVLAAMFFLLFAGAIGLSFPRVAQTIHVPTAPQHATNAATKVFHACKAYAADNGGRYPETLEELVPFYLEDHKLLVCPLNPHEEVGYLYFGGYAQDAGSELLLVSKGTDKEGRRILIRKDGVMTLGHHTPAPVGTTIRADWETSGVTVQTGLAR